MKIKIDNLRKEFKEITAVNNLNIEIEEGNLVSILGPSGCGKSTLMLMIAGLSKPSSGNIYFGDSLVNDIEAEDRDIGMVFQNYALYPHLTVLQNIMFPLKMKKIKKDIALNKAREIMKLVQIEDLEKRKPSQLSGGQQQRVAIARALVKEPKILLLDEPLSNLDTKLRIAMREEIKRIQNETKITTIFVTHDQEEAMSISDKILLMNKGKVYQYDNPKELYKNPINKFVAEFIGNPTMNIFKGRIEDKYFINENTRFCIDNYELNYKLKNQENDSVYLGIRPEDIYVDEDDYKIEGIVSNIENLGRELLIKIDLEESSHIKFIATWDNEIKIGKRIGLNFKKIHLFEGSY